MIKLMRESAHKYPWLLKAAMGVLAIAFVITMGWWGFGEQETDAVASVGNLTVTRDEFLRAYQNTYRFYKEKVQGDFKDETLKQFVLEGLIDEKIWTLVAEEMGLTVTPSELRDAIIGREEFSRNGKFDPELYRRLLAANRLTPSLFEAQEVKELLRLESAQSCRETRLLAEQKLQVIEHRLAGLHPVLKPLVHHHPAGKGVAVRIQNLGRNELARQALAQREQPAQMLVLALQGFPQLQGAGVEQLLPPKLLVVPLQLGLGYEKVADAGDQTTRHRGQPLQGVNHGCDTLAQDHEVVEAGIRHQQDN